MQDYSSGFRISRSDLLLIWNFWHSNSFSLDHILRHGHCIVFQTVSEFIEYRSWFQVSVLVLKYSISSWQADFYRNPCNQNIRWKSVTDLWCLQLSSGVWGAGKWIWYICVVNVRVYMMPWLGIILKIDINNMSAVLSRRCHSCTPPSQQRYLLTPSLIQSIFSAST